MSIRLILSPFSFLGVRKEGRREGLGLKREEMAEIRRLPLKQGVTPGSGRAAGAIWVVMTACDSSKRYGFGDREGNGRDV